MNRAGVRGETLIVRYVVNHQPIIKMVPWWELSGEYAEACNCDVACQCIMLEPPDGDFCTAALA